MIVSFKLKASSRESTHTATQKVDAERARERHEEDRIGRWWPEGGHGAEFGNVWSGAPIYSPGVSGI